MPLIDWKDEFETGIDFIDYEHRRLVRTINELCDSLEQAGAETSVSDCFGKLYAQVTAHFALEESVMRERKYGKFALHKADHERLLDEIRYIMESYEDGACESCEETLGNCLRAWFAGHFQTEDARFRNMRR